MTRQVGATRCPLERDLHDAAQAAPGHAGSVCPAGAAGRCVGPRAGPGAARAARPRPAGRGPGAGRPCTRHLPAGAQGPRPRRRVRAGRGPCRAALGGRGQRRGAVSPDVWAAVYFCYLEAFPNAAKHGGEGTRATVTIERRAEGVSCTVAGHGRRVRPHGASRARPRSCQRERPRRRRWAGRSRSTRRPAGGRACASRDRIPLEHGFVAR
jgi:hypothetical protein